MRAPGAMCRRRPPRPMAPRSVLSTSPHDGVPLGLLPDLPRDAAPRHVRRRSLGGADAFRELVNACVEVTARVFEADCVRKSCAAAARDGAPGPDLNFPVVELNIGEHPRAAAPGVPSTVTGSTSMLLSTAGELSHAPVRLEDFGDMKRRASGRRTLALSLGILPLLAIDERAVARIRQLVVHARDTSWQSERLCDRKQSYASTTQPSFGAAAGRALRRGRALVERCRRNPLLEPSELLPQHLLLQLGNFELGEQFVKVFIRRVGQDRAVVPIFLQLFSDVCEFGTQGLYQFPDAVCTERLQGLPRGRCAATHPLSCLCTGVHSPFSDPVERRT